MGLSYLRSNPFYGGGADDSIDADSSDPTPVDLSALSPDVFRRPIFPPKAGGGAPPPVPTAGPPSFGEPGPQGLFPAQGRAAPLSAPAPSDSSDAQSSGSLLSRFASRLGGFGTATTDEDQKQALRQALIQGGLTIASNASTRGLDALAPGLLSGFATYRGALEQTAAGREHAAQVSAAEDDRKARLAMDQGRYKDEAQLRQDALQDKRDQVQGKVDEKQARLDEHQKMLAEIAKDDPKTAARLAPLAGSATNAIETAYMASLKPGKPAKGPQLRDVPAGSALWSIDDEGNKKLLIPAAHLPGTSINLGWALERQSDGSIVRINKNTGEVAPVALPAPSGSSPAALGEERRKTAAGLFNAMVAAGTVPVGADGQFDTEAGYARSLEAADRLMAARRGGALAPGVTPPPAKPVVAPPAKPAEPGFFSRLIGGVTGMGTTPPAAASPAAPPLAASQLNPGGVAKTRALLGTLSPAAARQKLLSTGMSPAMVDAYLQAAAGQ